MRKSVHAPGVAVAVALLAAFALALVLGLGASSAQAVPLVKTGTFASAGSGAGQLSEPNGVAVEQATGDVYVADTGNNRVDKFDAQGNFILTFGKGVDQTTGENICTAVSGDICQAGTPGTEAPEFESPRYVAVDNSNGPSAGDVYVGNGNPVLSGVEGVREGARVSKFDGSGNFISVNTGAAVRLEGPFKNLAGIAVDSSGDLWVADSAIEGVVEFTQAGQFSNSPGLNMQQWTSKLGLLGSFGESSDMAVDGSHVFLVDNDPRVRRFSTSGAYQGSVTAEGAQSTHLAIDPGTEDLYVNEGGTVIEHYDSSCTPVTGISERRTNNGCQPIDSFGSGDLTRGAGLGLDTATTTLYAADASADQIVVFVPPAAGAPAIDSESVSSAGSVSATVNATITPLGHDASCEVQYVDDATFQSSGYAGARTVGCSPADLGSGFADQPGAAALTGLSPATSYHYRFAATNSAGATAGADRTFTTEATSGLPDNRAYEMVTPANKDSGQPLLPVELLWGDLAAVDGNGMAFISLEALPGSQAGGLDFLSTRDASGWSSQNQIPPQSTAGEVFCIATVTIPAYSSDLAKNVLIDGVGQQIGCGHDDPPLVPGEPQGVENLFVHDSRSGAYQLVSLNPVSGNPADARYDAASADLSHVVFDESAQLTAAAPSGADNLYDWSGGSVRLVTTLPGASLVGGEERADLLHAVSSDGSKIFFQAGGNLYVRKDGAQTAQLDASQGAGPGGGGQFQIASADGSEAFFSDDASAGLTGDTVPGSGQNLYRYDVATGNLTDLTPDGEASVQGVSGTSEDGSYVYFAATASLASGASAGQPNLYVSHAGTTTFIATLDPNEACDWVNLSRTFCARVSADGTRIAFDSDRPLTSIDTAGFIEIYLYDAASNTLACASCSRAGVATAGSASINQPVTSAFFSIGLTNYLPSNLSADGSRVFFNTAQPLAAGDSNGAQDVYEYEQAGAGGCKAAGGCVYLISNGTDRGASLFLGASASGSDIFFSTEQAMLPQDNDSSIDIYDARVNGGLASATAPPPCGGESCRPPATPAPASGPTASTTLTGTGNLAAPLFAPAARSKPPTRAQKLARALAACRRKPKKHRHGCKAQARKRYSPRISAGKSSHRSFVHSKGAK